jgi:hypothetical protein
LILYEFSDLFSMMYVAVVENENTARARIRICQWNLLMGSGHSVSYATEGGKLIIHQ